jgi:hypothetical protein
MGYREDEDYRKGAKTKECKEDPYAAQCCVDWIIRLTMRVRSLRNAVLPFLCFTSHHCGLIEFNGKAQ